MQYKLIFKGKSAADTYHWENVADVSPKQLYCAKNDVLSKAFPKVNQIYIVRYKSLEGSTMIDVYDLIPQYSTCAIWKYEKGEYIFKKGDNKGLTIRQYAACFRNNHEEEKKFLKRYKRIHDKSYNAITKCNIVAIFNLLADEGYLTFCEIFGNAGGSVFQSGAYKGVDITQVGEKKYPFVRKRLVWYTENFLNPVTVRNSLHWLKYLDDKYLNSRRLS